MPSVGSSPLARGTLRPPAERRGADRFIPARAGNTNHIPRGSGGGGVHPRSRGEHDFYCALTGNDTGSSPLARGTLLHLRVVGAVRRFIPARAGNTSSSGRAAGGQIGSSPLARGTRPVQSRRIPRRRFIPARAGNTRSRSLPDRLHCGSSPLARGTRRSRGTQGSIVSVHPRSRGEHSESANVSNTRTGSSPLARGTRYPSESVGCIFRFIPARAGNTSPPITSCAATPVHPRSRGEHVTIRGQAWNNYGSSPLARGTRGDAPEHEGSTRFIPARAGNTRAALPRPPETPVHPRSRGEHVGGGPRSACAAGSSPLARGTQRDVEGLRPCPSVHPRSRGEHSASNATTRQAIGSSPLARGTHGAGHHARSVRRFIPARAGNTRGASTPRTLSPVHPRSRAGKHARVDISGQDADGSSPLARGTRSASRRNAACSRFIPARAGNTGSPSGRRIPSPVHPRSRGEH